MIGKKKDKKKEIETYELVVRFEEEKYDLSSINRNDLKELVKFIKNYKVREYLEGNVEGAKAIEKILVSIGRLLKGVSKKD